MEKQQNFTDIEYTNRRRTTKREAFLEKMDATLPWNAWVSLVVPYYPDGKRGRKPVEIEHLTLDDDPEADYDGIIRKNALDWLMEE